MTTPSDPNSPPPLGQQPPPYPAPVGYAPVHYSPDGRFAWNGYQWIPTGTQRSTAHVGLLVFGGAAVVILIAVLLGIAAGHSTSFNEVFSNVSNGLQGPVNYVPPT